MAGEDNLKAIQRSVGVVGIGALISILVSIACIVGWVPYRTMMCNAVHERVGKERSECYNTNPDRWSAELDPFMREDPRDTAFFQLQFFNVPSSEAWFWTMSFFADLFFVVNGGWKIFIQF